MNRFKTFVEETPFHQIKEIYDKTFSPEGVCSPYVGYHVLGDGSHRRMFLAGLEEEYQMYDFSAANEEPDRLGIMLRFLVQVWDDEEKEEMVFLYVLPVLRRMLTGFVGRRTPYKEVLQALLLVLREGRETQSSRIPLGREVPEFHQSG